MITPWWQRTTVVGNTPQGAVSSFKTPLQLACEDVRAVFPDHPAIAQELIEALSFASGATWLQGKNRYAALVAELSALAAERAGEAAA